MAARVVSGQRARSVYADQVAGLRIPNEHAIRCADGQQFLSDITVATIWDDFRLIQPNARRGLQLRSAQIRRAAWIAAGSRDAVPREWCLPAM